MSSKTTTIIGIIILVVAIVIIGLVVSKKRAQSPTVDESGINQPAGAGAPLSGGTSTGNLEGDLNGTQFYQLDSELETLK